MRNLHRLNIQVTEEAAEILKGEATRLGSSIGTVVTMLALEKKKENDVLTTMDIIQKEKGKPHE